MPRSSRTGTPPDEETPDLPPISESDDAPDSPESTEQEEAPHPRDRTPGEEYEDADGVKSIYRKEEVEITRESSEPFDDEEDDE